LVGYVDEPLKKRGIVRNRYLPQTKNRVIVALIYPENYWCVFHKIKAAARQVSLPSMQRRPTRCYALGATTRIKELLSKLSNLSALADKFSASLSVPVKRPTV
jgi:hypothetical protein